MGKVFGCMAAGGGLGAIFFELCDDSLAGVLTRPERHLALCVFAQIRRALLYLHGKQVAHLDVKAGNTLWIRRTRRAILADFSLASVWVGQTTRTAHAHNSLNYRPPEQVRAVGPFVVRPATDTFAFGCLLWETGRHEAMCEAGAPLRREHLFPGSSERKVQTTQARCYGHPDRDLQAGRYWRAVRAYCSLAPRQRDLRERLQAPVPDVEEPPPGAPGVLSCTGRGGRPWKDPDLRG